MNQHIKQELHLLKQEFQTLPETKMGKDKVIPDSFKIKVTKFIKISGLPQAILVKNFGYTKGSTIISQWKRDAIASGEIEATGFIYGSTVRIDVPTKANIIRRHIENGEFLVNLAREVGVHYQTVSTWVTQYRDTYKQYLTAPIGTIAIAKKIIIGTQNIQDVRKQLNKNIEAIEMLLRDKGLQFNTVAVSGLKKAKRDSEAELKERDQLEDLKNKYPDAA